MRVDVRDVSNTMHVTHLPARFRNPQRDDAAERSREALTAPRRRHR
jgi:hypothetical protein